MKKILFILAVGFLFSVKADAQVFPLYGTTLDTLTNTDSTSYVVDARNSASIDVIGHLGLTRVSGTGTVTVRVYTQNFNKESARWTHIATTTVGTTATNSLINCLGNNLRDKGQSLVPDPPAIITGFILLMR